MIHAGVKQWSEVARVAGIPRTLIPERGAMS
jgi:hypothetical protein